MPFTLTMPKLSPTMEEGTITKWRARVGEQIKAGDVILEIATDKATVEHSALDGGWLRKILVEEGAGAIVNQPIAIFTENKEESIEGYQPEGVSPKAEVKEVSTVSQEAVISSPKKESVPLGQATFSPEPPLAHYDMPGVEESVSTRLFTTPLARKLAREKGLDLSSVKGSGPHQRITCRDLPLAQGKTLVGFGRRQRPELLPGTYEEESLSPMRKVIAQRLQEAKTFIPHFTVVQSIDAEPLTRVREELKAGDLKVSVNDFIVRAVALSLREHPVINSGFNSVNGTIIRFKTIDVAIAVSVEAGLITPIIRHADFKNLGELAIEVKHLALRAKEGKLAREEYMGGSFTISNLGMFGITQFAGILNPPQAALLAVGGVEDKPVVKAGAVVPGKTLQLTLSADHRVIDGVDAAKFLKSIQKFLENPSLLII